MEDVEALLLSLFTALEVPHMFSAVEPSYFTIAKFATGPEDKARLRSGYAPAIAYGLLVGGMVSLLIKDARPLIFSSVVIVLMVVVYEGAIRNAGETVSLFPYPVAKEA